MAKKKIKGNTLCLSKSRGNSVWFEKPPLASNSHLQTYLSHVLAKIRWRDGTAVGEILRRDKDTLIPLHLSLAHEYTIFVSDVQKHEVIMSDGGRDCV